MTMPVFSGGHCPLLPVHVRQGGAGVREGRHLQAGQAGQGGRQGECQKST